MKKRKNSQKIKSKTQNFQATKTLQSGNSSIPNYEEILSQNQDFNFTVGTPRDSRVRILTQAQKEWNQFKGFTNMKLSMDMNGKFMNMNDSHVVYSKTKTVI